MNAESGVAPQGLRWTQIGPTEAALGAPRSWPLFWLVGTVWNLGFAGCGAWSDHPKAHNQILPGLAFSALFAVLLVRSFFVRTRIACTGGQLRITPPLGSGSAFALPLVEIARFEARRDDAKNRSDLFAVLVSGTSTMLPLDVEPTPIGWKGSKRQFWSAPPDHARYVADRLEAMRAHALREGHDSYRT